MSLFSMPGKEKHSGASFEKNSALRFPWTRSLTSPDFILLASSGTPEKTPGTGMLPGSSAAGRGVNPQKCFSPRTPRLPRSHPRASPFGLPLAGDPAGTRQHVFCARNRRIPGKFLSRSLSRAIGVAVLIGMMHPAAGLAEPPRWNLRYTGAVPQLNLEWK